MNSVLYVLLSTADIRKFACGTTTLYIKYIGYSWDHVVKQP